MDTKLGKMLKKTKKMSLVNRVEKILRTRFDRAILSKKYSSKNVKKLATNTNLSGNRRTDSTGHLLSNNSSKKTGDLPK